MKYKVLLTGRNETVIDDFFMQMGNSFEVMTTSARYEDIIRHLTYFLPDVFVYCLYHETRDDIVLMSNLRLKLSQSRIPLVAIGLKEDCDVFERVAVNAAALTLYRPLSVGAIQEKIIDLLKDRRFLEVMDAQGAATAVAVKEAAVAREAAEKKSAAKEAAQTAVQASAGRESKAAAQTAPAEELQRKHVLVVDDNAMMLKVIKEHLHDKYDVATAVSGKVALKFLERKRTDLILLDYEMPDESGPVVLEKLRASDETKDIPVIFLTGVTESKKIKEALALKPQNYLLKPVDREKLMDTIAREIG